VSDQHALTSTRDDASAYTTPAPGPTVDTPPPLARPVNGRAAKALTRERRPSRKQLKVAGRLRARKVRRIVRHVDPWSMLKVSLIFYFCLYLAVLVAGVILWNLASSAGTIDDLENLVADYMAYRTFEFEADLILRASVLGGLVLVIVGAGLNMLAVVLFNLISDLVGGVRMTVIEEETARPAAPTGS
jgi:hypothetical protein